MEKISGIIHSSPRVTSVDLKEASPVRPGTPSFGRPEGLSAIKDRIAADGQKKSAEARAEMMDWQSKEDQHANIATSVADRFFMKNKQEALPQDSVKASFQAPSKAPVSRSVPEESRVEDFGIDEDVESAPAPSAIAGPYPKGSFIDYRA